LIGNGIGLRVCVNVVINLHQDLSFAKNVERTAKEMVQKHIGGRLTEGIGRRPGRETRILAKYAEPRKEG
jgi:hypothetical protein